MPQVHFYGWKPDKPDHRDLHFVPHPKLALAPVPFVDQRKLDPPVYDQAQEGSCTGNAASAIDYRAAKALGKDLYIPSRDGLYGQALIMEGSFGYDNGAEIRDLLKVITQIGSWPEDRPGDPANQPYTQRGYQTKASAASLAFGQNHQGLVYARVAQNLCTMKTVLAQGYPIIIGFTVYESFESAATNSTGIVTMPKSNEGVLGGHAVVIVGYDEDGGNASPVARSFIVRNSWGTSWGDAGYCYFPYEYLTSSDLSDDFWVLQSVE